MHDNRITKITEKAAQKRTCTFLRGHFSNAAYSPLITVKGLLGFEGLGFSSLN